jgi:hypothetical protein
VVLATETTDLANSIQRLFVTDMAAQGIRGVRGIYHHAAAENDLRRPHQQPSLRVRRVHGEVLTHFATISDLDSNGFPSGYHANAKLDLFLFSTPAYYHTLRDHRLSIEPPVGAPMQAE